jgi:hypothetical protein
VADEKPPLDRALDLFVYAPVGVALYVRDMFPSMMGVFVARGKREVKSHLGTQEPPPPVAPPPVADLRRKMGESVGLARGVAEGGLGLARDVTGTALQGLIGFRNGVARPAEDESGAASDPEFPRPVRVVPSEPPAAPAAAPSPPASPAASASVASPVAATPPSVESLPIPDYDELSASQVIERLEGLDRSSLEAIRAYETQHRARNTILGKIAQLS